MNKIRLMYIPVAILIIGAGVLFYNAFDFYTYDYGDFTANSFSKMLGVISLMCGFLILFGALIIVNWIEYECITMFS